MRSSNLRVTEDGHRAVCLCLLRLATPIRRDSLKAPVQGYLGSRKESSESPTQVLSFPK